jgi:prepilin-type N-terminal cleavage/methylation domain-containing protein
MKSLRRSGFTLIELLAVILILAILIALLVPALAGAIRTVRRASVSTEIRSLQQGVTSFAVKYGGTVPVSVFVCSESGDYSADFMSDAGISEDVRVRSLTFLRAAFPRVRVSATRLVARTQCSISPGGLTIAGIGFYDFNGNGTYDPAPYVLTGDECLVLWLGGMCKPSLGSDGTARFATIGIATDPYNPWQPDLYLDCAGQPTTPSRSPPIIEFRSDRLIDLRNNLMPCYVDSYNGSSSPTPYVYFAKTGSSYEPDDCGFPTEPNGEPSPLAAFYQAGRGRVGVFTSQAPNPYASTRVLPVTGAYQTGPLAPNTPISVVWINSQFQIIAAGADRQYGPGGWYDASSSQSRLLFPAVANATATGQALPPNARQVENDNLTNFTSDTLQ